MVKCHAKLFMPVVCGDRADDTDESTGMQLFAVSEKSTECGGIGGMMT